MASTRDVWETHLARATRKPKRNGETKGEMMKPIVQILSYAWRVSRMRVRPMSSTVETDLPCLKVEGIHVCDDV